MTIRALASSRQDFLKQTKQPKASAVSSSKVLSGSGGFGLNLEDQAGTQQETVMSQCAAEGFEVEYKLAEQSTKAAELHEARHRSCQLMAVMTVFRRRDERADRCSKTYGHSMDVFAIWGRCLRNKAM
mmetsp:Transcript_29569/g.59699  ORF Transcript_29569/g.59699 Transcript_29569/m.59699 type:complete len:128 (+) Transcript_29569:253-636(+)